MSATATPTRIWSHYQEDIFRAVESSRESLVVEAVAGSGKTSTLVECAHRLSEFENAVAVAFNVRIKDELTKRLPPNVAAVTFNSLGFRAWKTHVWKSMEVDAHKTATLVREMSSNSNPDYRKGVKQLVDLAKMTGIVPKYVKDVVGLVPDTDDAWRELIEEYGVQFGWGGADGDAIDVARRVLAESIRVGGERIDFPDQMYLPVVFGTDFQKYDTVFVDEAQDVSGIQRVMIERSVGDRGRMVAFGDGSQALYHFRGAGDDSLPLLQEKFSARRMPLSICYRCSKAVVRRAKELVPEIEWCEEASEGKVVDNFAWTPETFITTDVILCRNNAPLVQMAFRLIRASKACKVLGRDIGSGLIGLVRRLRAETVTDLRTKLTKYEVEEMASLGDHESQKSALADRCATLRVFLENSRTPEEVIWKIEGLFADEAKGVTTLSTVHKAKGLEWPRVFLLDSHLIGSRARQVWEQQAEKNVLYVGVTRAKSELYFIRS